MEDLEKVSTSQYEGAEYVSMLCQQWVRISNDFLALEVKNGPEHTANAAVQFLMSICKSFHVDQERFDGICKFMMGEYSKEVK